jgi:hypothetical protein
LPFTQVNRGKIMADKKISALTGASTPLAGTEVLPIVQGGATVKVAVSDLTAGRAVSTSTITGTTSLILGAAASEGRFNANGAGIDTVPAVGKSFRILNAAQSVSLLSMAENVGDLNVSTGNLVIGTSGKGIDFSANSGTAGMTSELLNWYEEGTWTPTQGAGLTVVGAFSSAGTYTRIGRLVTVKGNVDGATSILVTSGSVLCAGLPFASSGNSVGGLTVSNINQRGNVVTISSSIYSVQTTTADTSIIFTVTYNV